MDVRSLLGNVNFNDRRDVYIALTAPVLGVIFAATCYRLASSAFSQTLERPSIYAAPSGRTVSDHKNRDSPYPPDALPGSRDIDSPYGNIRAYEWGPKDGRKVLFIHGISTPCIALARLANSMVSNGCRVMLFDMLGRGYSDSPDPNTHRQDIGLLSSQILTILASSELNWMNGFALIGYSLGGGVASSFTSYFPRLVRSLILIAPGGLIRRERISQSSKFLCSGILPDSLAYRMVHQRLRDVGFPKMTLPEGKTVNVTETVDVISPDGYVYAQNSESPIFADRPQISPSTAVDWQLRVHPGFVPAFVSSMRHAPIYDGYARWRLIGKRCEDQRMLKESQRGSGGLEDGKVLLLLGIDDLVILPEETAVDATAALGEDNIKIVGILGGHDIPITQSELCSQVIVDFWNGQQLSSSPSAEEREMER